MTQKFRLEDLDNPEAEPVLVLTIEEAQAIADCPFANVNANDANYPGYNDAMGKIFNFANTHRKEQ